MPGPDAFPVDLSAIISSFYARAGFVELENGSSGSITFIGTVSPAGGNLKEPVTESTKKAARCYYALSQERADSKRYPAIDPIDSYSKYLEYDEFKSSISESMGEDWLINVEYVRDLLIRGKEIREQLNILGDDGLPVEHHILFWKAELVDFVIMQQDAFDKIDRMCPLERQKYMLVEVIKITQSEFEFRQFEEVAEYFRSLINTLKQMNYSEFLGDQFTKYEKEMNAIIKERRLA